jgi:23S rRNA (guanosine2251-2'-O)-methyltransferase
VCRPTWLSSCLPRLPSPISALLPHPLVVVVDDLRSAFNVGAVFRTADAAGLAGVYLTGYSATPEHREVRKTALGAEDAVPWQHAADLGALLARLRSEGFTIAALERTPGAISPDEAELKDFPMALVLGNEVHGVKPEVLSAADVVVGLPQYGSKTSLNVAVAFGVAAYGLVARYRSLAG